MTYAETWARQKNRVEQALEVYPFSGAPEKLRSAMRYSLLSGGKRLRGVLALASCEMGGGDWHDAEKLAVAVEMIHAYSLIHDDLPAMDNDTLRRGKPTNHVVYGEAMAILAGDGLLTEAFSVLADIRHPAGGAVLREVARAAGPAGMAGGQALDMEASLADASGVRLIHSLKTGRLITAPIVGGLLLAGADEKQAEAGRAYGAHLGAAFQIIDDLLDLTGDEKSLGKHAGKDAQEGKKTWPGAVGVPQALRDAGEETCLAVKALDLFGENAEFLRQTAREMLTRVC